MKRINLLPKNKQIEISHEKTFYSVSVAVVISTLIIFIGIAVQFGVLAYLNNEISSVNAEIEQLKKAVNKSENAAVKMQIKTANAQISDFLTLDAGTPHWSTVMAAFVTHVPDNVRITQFEGKTSTGEITITGFSPTRDLVIDLYNNINSDKEHFKDINYPLENVTQPTNVRFNFQFFVADKVLVKDVK